MGNPLPWIKLYASLPGHEKSGRLAKLLGNDRAWTHVIELWLWASQHQPDGNLDTRTDTAIGIAAGWYQEPARFTQAIREVGFLDADGQLHGWSDEQGAHVEKLKADRERKRAEREALKSKASKDSPSDSPEDAPRDSPATVHATLSKNQREEILEKRVKNSSSTLSAVADVGVAEQVLLIANPEKGKSAPKEPPTGCNADRTAYEVEYRRLSGIPEAKFSKAGAIQWVKAWKTYGLPRLLEALNGLRGDPWGATLGLDATIAESNIQKGLNLKKRPARLENPAVGDTSARNADIHAQMRAELERAYAEG